MKHVVTIEIHESTPMSNRMEVKLNGVIRGVVDLEAVEHPDSPVMTALVLLGFSSVQHLDEDGSVTRVSAADVLRSMPISSGGLFPATRGNIQLTRRWSEPLEEYRLDVANEGKRLGSVDAKMNMGTLRAILVLLGFTVGQIQEAAQVA